MEAHVESYALKDSDFLRAEARERSYAPQGDSDPLWAKAHVESYAGEEAFVSLKRRSR